MSESGRVAWMFKAVACFWWFWGAWVLIYGWTRPPEFWVVTYGPPSFFAYYGGSLWFRTRAAIWLGVSLLGLLFVSGAINGMLQWRGFQGLLIAQLLLVGFTVVHRK
jgi:hypothetical protein